MNQCFNIDLKRRKNEYKKKLIIINGTGTSGKDTFVNYVSQYAKVFNFSSIDVIKEIAGLKYLTCLSGDLIEKIGYNGSKTEKDRKFLSDLKSLFKNYNDLPLHVTLEATLSFIHSENELMFIHIREPEEITRTIDALIPFDLDVSTLLIKRDGLENISSNNSDKNVDAYDYDEIIINHTLEDLNSQARLFAEKTLEYRKQ